MNRNILLIEPNYQNKYPPIGLMKISSYHKMLGDNVRFFKGNVNTLIIEGRTIDCIKALRKIDNQINWEADFERIYNCLKERTEISLENYLKSVDSNYIPDIEKAIRYYKKQKPSAQYDRVYVTSLFTFYWRVTIKAIKQAKSLVAKSEDLLVGGVMASLLHKEVEVETGIKPHTGLLDRPGILDEGNSIIIDDLPLDYSLLHEIDYDYPTQSAYFTFMTKGCTRKCAFCSVPILEPTYKEKIPTINKFDEINRRFGEQRNLLLMDNNVLASPKFPEIAQDILDMGFYKGAKYLEPNQYEISIKNLQSSFNDKSYIKKIGKLLIDLYHTRLKKEIKEEFKNLLVKYELGSPKTISKGNIIKSYSEISPIYEKYRKKGLIGRYVDFNQGVDGRYVNEDNMRLLSKLNIKPLRIAFDYVGMKKQYIAAVELAAKYGLKNLSNYLLYNFKDSPDELYERLKINVDLNLRLGLKIFSFPMKYIPLFGEESKDRKHIGPKWNKKFIRAIQSILNVTKGIVAPGSDFFEIAFGKSLAEFREILYMPEPMIIYRSKFAEAGITQEWRNCMNALAPEELALAKTIIEKNNFENALEESENPKIQMLLHYYAVNSKQVDRKDLVREKLRNRFNRLIKRDIFIDLTLTYDYDRKYRKPKEITLVSSK